MAADKKISETEAFASVFDMLVHAIGPEKVLYAIKHSMAKGKKRRVGQ
jgi:hypothetical protein